MVLTIVIAVTAAFATYFLSKLRYFNALRASSLLSLIAYALFSLMSTHAELYSVVFFGGTFVGMSTPARFGYYTLTSAAVLFALLFHYLVPHLHGYGGALGVSAFLSVCLCQLAIVLGAPRSRKSG
ncbi:hypothetical protein FIU82_18025 (plasmid) [Pseudoalteromonas sp. THAF3]|uniref:hypothetical protein n=1 Tax=Pseudoalteromonas TaxID=53246 RepID=UPI001268E39E|nr:MULTISPECIES: hypothetical protein [Pseudoalteromonas]MCG7545773.1 hypothetical protein [Pseudoalteromonas sp. MM17-2]MCG7565457.1 hypothetical protein [Pseudoalteromonas sp. CnMc7-15]QFU06896.1 hypothetical protein FIU82_18025 [Pseudoalteromonas sp. THAF3]|tara:strand:- start:102 stop:479 length:378 start_codon:yes stop_codon:yes gene_type:complete